MIAAGAAAVRADSLCGRMRGCGQLVPGRVGSVWNQLACPAIGAALFAAGTALPFVSETVCVLAGVLLISRARLPAHLGRARPARVREDIREG